MIDGCNERIVERSAAPRLDPLQSRPQFADVRGIVLVKKRIFAEVDDEHPILLLACVDELQSRFVNLRPLR